MRTATLCSLIALLPATIQGIQLKERSAGSTPAVVGASFEKTRVPRHKNDKRRRRDNSYAVDLANEKVLYNAQIELGTPAQTIQAQIDTGSSDLWVNSPDSQICKSKGSPCESSGTYNKTKSSTWKRVNSDFNITYVDGSGASGDYGTDVFKFGDLKLDKLQFGVGLNSTSENCVFGIGYPANEVYLQKAGTKPYANLPQALVDEGLINSRAYSLYLDSVYADKGQILFGGVDTEKFQGTLQTVPLTKPSSGVYVEFAVDLTSINITQDGTESKIMTGAVPCVLDSGSTFNNLPSKLVASMNKKLNGFYDSQLGIDVVPCSAMNSEDSMTFSFSGADIKVPLNQMILEPSTLGMSSLTDDSGNQMCIFGTVPLDSDSSTAILGDTFLRAAYLVYDLDNNEISFANANMNATKSNILEIGTGTNAVPSATGVANAVTTGDVVATGVTGPMNPTGTENSGVRPTAKPEQALGLLGAAAGLAAFL
ncbi:replication factor C subunit 4 [Ascosphaera pollenicola]|nr:replication factor C subunit 4 [Ascosphaera pollenicola]